MNQRPLNLCGFCNHKLVYDLMPDTQTEIGLDNIYIQRQDLRWNTLEQIDGTCFRFNFGSFDNVVCDSQIIPIGEKIKKLHVIGFAYWGDTNEMFQIKYFDGSVERYNIPFIDWSHRAVDNVNNAYIFQGKQIYTPKIVISSGALVHTIHIHHCICNLEVDKVIKEIVFPDNMFIHIFAVTIES